MTTREILIAARERIKQGWCQFELARDCDGNPCSELSHNASRWCAYGALEFAILDIRIKCLAAGALRKVVGQEISGWNNFPGRTQQEVIEAFDKAIAACGEEP